MTFPDATTTGPAAGGYTNLIPVSGQVINSGSVPDWCVQQEDGSWLIEGLLITGALDIDLTGGVAMTGCQVVVGGGGSDDAIIWRETGWSMSYCEVSAPDDDPADRVSIAVQDLAGGGTLGHCNIYWCRQCLGTGSNDVTITDCYLHDLVFEDGDHSENIYLGGAGMSGIAITGNTILNPLDQTACVFMDNASAGPAYDGVTISGNYIAGGTYAIYGGTENGGVVTSLVIENNTFGTDYFPGVGSTGLLADVPAWGTNGNEWSANTAGGLVSFTVTAAQGGSTAAKMAGVLEVLTGASASQPGTTAAANALSASVTPAHNGSWIYTAAVASGSPSILTGQTTLQSTASTDRYYQLRTTATQSAGTPFTAGLSGGTALGVAAMEVVPSGTLAQDASAPVVSGLISATSWTTAAFTPPASSLLVLTVSCEASAGVMTLTVTDTSGLGLTWVQQAVNNGSVEGYAGVWTAQVPAPAPPVKAKGGAGAIVPVLFAADLI